MQTGGRKRGPDAQIAKRRAMVLLRRSLGMSERQISASLMVPKTTIHNDIKEIERWQKESFEVEGTAIRARVVCDLLELIKEMLGRINKEYRQAKVGSRSTEAVLTVPKKGQLKDATDPEVLLDFVERKLSPESKKIMTKPFMPRLQGVAALYKVIGEYYKLILNAFDFATTKRIETKTTEKTLIAGVAVIVPKAKDAESWQNLADVYAEGEETIAVEVVEDAPTKN